MRTVLKIEGMRCAHCAKRVQKALLSVDGVEKVVVNLDERTAAVTLEDVDSELLVEAVTDAGYEVLGVSADDQTEGSVA